MLQVESFEGSRFVFVHEICVSPAEKKPYM